MVVNISDYNFLECIDMDEDISLGERLTRTLSAMAFILPTVAAGFKFLADAKKAETLATNIGSLADHLNTLAKKENTAATIANENETKTSANAKMEEVASYIKSRVEEYKTAKNAPATTIIQNTFSVADEIKKFKELLDSGIITQEEFDAKKKQLLGL